MFGAVRILAMTALALTSVSVRGAVGWKNLDEGHRLSGRRASAGYLQGKVVMVDRWAAKSQSCSERLPRLEAIWQSFKGPSFVLLGGHCSRGGTEEEARRLIRETGVTYPVYADAGLSEGEPAFRKVPFVYVVDPTGTIRYQGRSEREATDVVVGLVAKWDSPKTLEDWKSCLEYELLNQPAHALLRFERFEKAFPAEAPSYSPQVSVLKRLPGMEDLLRLVRISVRVYEYRPKDAHERQVLAKRIAETVDKYAFLKQSKDPQIAQEAKNALAEMQWSAVEP